ncbi:hypothetical protein PR202_gb26642 [Eleusine coracana subsp. coracana]|uniref:Glycosyltransferase 61 catalytic domain-containing protein n=1 Tax=Eleusine coracana subsp. coracana TaxID=191504 RepID=A0AAV5FPE7_ELECO|nr:hypothetical protein PR202_gb26642 [Eleusine coracana subsp. coracana]
MCCFGAINTSNLQYTAAAAAMCKNCINNRRKNTMLGSCKGSTHDSSTWSHPIAVHGVRVPDSRSRVMWLQHIHQRGSIPAASAARASSSTFTNLRLSTVSFVVVGALLVVLTYLLLSQQFAVSARYVVITKQQRQATVEQGTKAPADGEAEKKKGKVACSSEGYFSESCVVDGDVRVDGTSLSAAVGRGPPRCRRPARHGDYTVPAVLFAIGRALRQELLSTTSRRRAGASSSRRYAGEVQFLVSNIVQPQWLDKYETLLHHLSKFELVHLDGDAHVRCFPRVTVGLHIHKLFSIVPESSTPGVGSRGLTMADFTEFLREAYALPRHAAVNLLAREPDKKKKKKPRLLLIHREQYRRLVNEEEIVHAAEAAGFEAAVMELLRGDTPVAEQARAVNSFDAMVGVHGAGLTNAAFLPPGAVLVQVVPYGKMESIAASEFGEPAADMG